MSTFELEALRARHGDALLLHVGSQNQRQLIMIDGGAARAYDDALKPRLRQLRGRRRAPLDIRLLMVSHIDDDHINGVLDLTSELIDADDEEEPQLVRIRELWHNSFSDAIATSAAASGPNRVQESALEVASAAGSDPEIASSLGSPCRLVLESVRQGRRLRRDAARLKIPTNREFAGKVVLRETAPSEGIQIGDVQLQVIGPSQAELDDLKKRWRKDLKKILEKEKNRQLALQAADALDTSVFNLASIVVLAQSNDKRMLLTGDARGDMILRWLEDAGLLDEAGRLHVDLLKLPHHGSDRNIVPGFFERITADHYVVSGDGKHGNPEPETLDMLFSERGLDDAYTVHMTYGPHELQSHPEFEGQKLRRLLRRHPGSRNRLRFPAAGEPSISIAL